MSDLIGGLTDWVIDFAESDWAILILGVNSFIEAIFFPVPPDALLVGVAILQPQIAVWLGVLVALTSVAGAVVGHWLGKRLGRPMLDRLFSETRILQVERMFDRFGMWATLLAAFTPIPYKVFAVTAGALRLDLKTFVVASLIGRGARYVLIGALVFAYGEEMESFIAGHFAVITVATGAALVASVVVWTLVRRRRGGPTIA